jgi:hypothetical protein
MATNEHMATIADDERHIPGPGALPLWNESFWFPFYDPKAEIGVVLRAGMHPNQQHANLYLFITHHGEIVHTVIDHRSPVPAQAPRRLTVQGFEMEWEPRQRFHLRYAQGAQGFDVVWQSTSPIYKYPEPPDTPAEQYPRHLEGAGAVTGTVTIAGKAHAIDCLGHRDHSWGGERDWAKMYAWDYLSGELGRDYWFNAVRIKLSPDMDYIFIGCLWDGEQLHTLGDMAIETRTADGGARQTGVELRATDERGRRHLIVSEEQVVNLPVLFGRTWLKDAIVRYRSGERTGFGIHELGYVERA